MDRIKVLTISLAVLFAVGGSAFAESTQFTPLNFNDSTYSSSNTSSTVIASTNTNNSSSSSTVQAVDLTGNKKMQSAISELDNAQVEVRNELLNYKTKYSEVDAQYNALKTERSNLAKQVKATEKRIKQLDKAKEKIRKNMM